MSDTMPIGLTEKSPHVELVRAMHAHYVGLVAALEGIDASLLAVGVKATNVDLTTRNGFRWPLVRSGDAPVKVEATKWIPSNVGSCPIAEGDGLCIGLQASALTSGNVATLGCATGLVLVYAEAESLGDDDAKRRAPRVWVVDTFQIVPTIKALGVGANLRGADLSGANLRYADLRYADLRGAIGANTTGAVQ